MHELRAFTQLHISQTVYSRPRFANEDVLPPRVRAYAVDANARHASYMGHGTSALFQLGVSAGKLNIRRTLIRLSLVHINMLRCTLLMNVSYKSTNHTELLTTMSSFEPECSVMRSIQHRETRLSAQFRRHSNSSSQRFRQASEISSQLLSCLLSIKWDTYQRQKLGCKADSAAITHSL